jgi:hypothetical protein
MIFWVVDKFAGLVAFCLKLKITWLLRLKNEVEVRPKLFEFLLIKHPYWNSYKEVLTSDKLVSGAAVHRGALPSFGTVKGYHGIHHLFSFFVRLHVLKESGFLFLPPTRFWLQQPL